MRRNVVQSWPECLRLRYVGLRLLAVRGNGQGGPPLLARIGIAASVTFGLRMLALLYDEQVTVGP